MMASGESQLQKTERLALLRQRAQAVLVDAAQGNSQPVGNDDTNQQHTLQLLEDLRIYQVELELQNEELRTAQHDAEQARQRYQYLFSQLPLAAMVVDGQGVIDECNARADTLLGPRQRAVKADMRLWKVLTGQDRTRIHQALRNVAIGEATVLPLVSWHGDNAKAPVFDVHLISLSIDYKLDRRVLMLWVDRSAEQARQADQRFYTSLIDSSDAFIYAADTEGKFLLANQALLQFLGHPQDEVVGHKREDFLPLRDAILHREADQMVLQDGHARTLEEHVHAAPPVGHQDFLTRKFPLRDAAGHVYGVGGISTNISALKDQQRQLLLSEAVFQNATEAVIVTDADTRILRVNPAFSRQTGFSAPTVVGQKANVLKSGRHDAAFYQAIWQALDRDGAWSGEINNRRADGSFYTVWSSINAVRDADGAVLNYMATQSDVTQLHNAQLALVHQASYDILTGLPNRALFNDRLAQLMAASQRHSKSFALLFVDLDRFKEVNDTLGHQVGDALLQEVARRLQQSVRTEDTVARIGGDEFVVMLTDLQSEPTAARIHACNLAEKICASLAQPYVLSITQANGDICMIEHRCTASMGLTLFSAVDADQEQILRRADAAMYQAKEQGRNRVVFSAT